MNSKLLRPLIFIAFVPIALASLAFSPAQAQLAERESLGLTGCAVTDVNSSNDGNLLIAGCEGPKGAYYSTDNGDTWTFAAGGDYTAGQLDRILMTSTAAYASIGSRLYKADISTTESWTPNWVELTSIGDLSNPYMVFSGSHYILVGNNSTAIKVIDTETDSLGTAIDVPGDSDTPSVVAVSSGYIFIKIASSSSLSTLYRAQFNNSNATLLSGWEDISDHANLPTNVNHWSIFVNSENNNIYVSTRTNDSTPVSETYVSLDNGDTFTSLNLNSVMNEICFSGNSIIMGSKVSTDDGVSFIDPTAPISSGDLRFEDKTCLFSPADPEIAYMGTNNGLARTNNFSSGASATWTYIASGMESVIIKSMSQAKTNSDRVVMGTSAGVAVTNNFTDDSPQWTFPICPNGDCVGGRRIILDSSNPDIVYYGSGSISKGAIDTSGDSPTITWSPLSNLPSENFWYFTEMTMYDFLPTRLYAAYTRVEGATDGGIYYYDTTSGTPTKVTDSDIDGKPISAFIALSSDVMFAGQGGFGLVQSDLRGIFKSTDGGTTWEEMTSDSLSTTPFVGSFAYDAINDILYAATYQDPSEGGGAASGGEVYRLEGALEGTGTWEKVSANFTNSDGVVISNPNLTVVVVDPSTGNIYLSGGQYIWLSTDHGDSWMLYYSGLTNEQTNVFMFDTEEALGATGIGAFSAERSRLIQGSNTGLYQFNALDNFLSNLTSPVYALWNGYLEMTNILELINKGSEDLPVTVKLYDISGVEQYQTAISIAAGGQRDVILNSLQGFSANSYGIVGITFTGSNLEGRLTFYRNESDATNYEFVFAVPFSRPLTGTTAVGFNTFQPSTNPIEASDPVGQWLSIVNLDSSDSKDFTLTRYNQAGTELVSGTQTVEAMRRKDVEGGHENPGHSFVGLNVITPSDSSAPYLAHLIRYGSSSSLGAGHYAFAFPLIASEGSGDIQWVPVSNGAGGDNWVEIINADANDASVLVELYDNLGVRQMQQTVSLASHAQQHLYASGYLQEGMTGAVKITPSDSSAKIIAQSMFYFRNTTGSIEAMYGSQSKTVSTGDKTGSYNLYLGMYNWLRLFNTSDSAQTITLSVAGADGSSHDKTINLDANSGIDLGLHETSNYGTQADTYGLCTVNGPVLAELLRLRIKSAAEIDYAAPTVVR